MGGHGADRLSAEFTMLYCLGAAAEPAREDVPRAAAASPLYSILSAQSADGAALRQAKILTSGLHLDEAMRLSRSCQ